jgi:hypothetical protein
MYPFKRPKAPERLELAAPLNIGRDVPEGVL